MDKVEEFRHRARLCRRMATVALSPEFGARYMQLAEVWEQLADERLTYFVADEPPDPAAH
jgi:hypothetical protein